MLREEVRGKKDLVIVAREGRKKRFTNSARVAISASLGFLNSLSISI